MTIQYQTDNMLNECKREKNEISAPRCLSRNETMKDATKNSDKDGELPNRNMIINGNKSSDSSLLNGLAFISSSNDAINYLNDFDDCTISTSYSDDDSIDLKDIFIPFETLYKKKTDYPPCIDLSLDILTTSESKSTQTRDSIDRESRTLTSQSTEQKAQPKLTSLYLNEDR